MTYCHVDVIADPRLPWSYWGRGLLATSHKVGARVANPIVDERREVGLST
jgi:hypothetical protein